MRTLQHPPNIYIHIFLFALTTTFLFLIPTTTSSFPTRIPPPPYPPLPHDDPHNSTFLASTQLCIHCLSDHFEFLYAHNLVRAAHGEPPFIWDTHMESYARWWAGQRWGDCRLEHSFPEGGFTLGENVFWGGGSAWTPSDAVRAWAAEEKYYDYRANDCEGGEMCGHYTQLIWRKSWKVGCARVVCEDGDTFITCNYDPPGNVIGERPY